MIIHKMVAELFPVWVKLLDISRAASMATNKGVRVYINIYTGPEQSS